MMKIILGFVAFLLTFGLSSTLVGLIFGFPQETNTSQVYQLRSDSSTARRIESLLRRDVRNGEARHRIAVQAYRDLRNDESLYADAKYRLTVLRYVENSSSMSDAGLPRDFQYAWREHMDAWKKQAAYVRSKERVNEEFNAESESVYSDNTSEINETWYQVLRIAQRYGVEIDESFYR
ncbi:MAG: hypothetical protein R2681_02785 [Pyrinomonadaceae bacterium]